MLTNITLENFKAFQKLDNLKVKPITILCGTNSCGKSSILQSILLLKQTLESKKSNQNLLLNGPFVKLGYFQDVIFRKKIEKHMSFDFVFNTKPELYNVKNGRRPPIELLLRDLIGDRGSMVNRHSEHIIDYKISLKAINNQELVENEYSKSLGVADICIKIFEKNQDNDKSKIVIAITNIKEDVYKVEWSNLKSRYSSHRDGENLNGSMNMRMQFENLLPIAFSPENPTEQRENHFQNIRLVLHRMNDLLQSFFSNYSYVGPLRQSHKDGFGFYFGDDITDIGNSGENAPFLFLKEKDNILKNHFFYNKKDDSFFKKDDISLDKAFDEWFALMGIKGFGGTISNRNINLHLNASKFDTTRIDISQVGFGVSQMFPIVLEGLRMEKGNTLLLEQPEIHLHPNLQMQMADYFISLALSGKRVMAETHSDHIINRLVRRIVEDDSQNLKDLLGIYFIKPSENGSVYEEIHIDETKGITNWPVDFFDQTATEHLRIMQAGLKKRKNIRNHIQDSL